MDLRKRLTDAAAKVLKEGVDSSAEMINDNLVPSFDDMGMANVTPGEFAQEEITDTENLVNKADMSNDTDFNKEDCNHCDDMIDKAEKVMDDLVDISAPSMSGSVEIVKTSEDYEEDKHHHFGESAFAKIVKSALGGKSCEQYLAKLNEATDYAGPLDFVPDTRINVSDVIKTLKNEIGDGSEGLHVDQVYDERKNNAYKVSQIEKDKLPKTLTVRNLKLNLDDDTYKIDEKSEDFPVAK